MTRTAVIVDVVRTPSGRGKPGGALSGIHPVDLAAHVLRAIVDRNGIDPARIDDILLGCVSQVGEQTMNIARQAALAAGLPESIPGATIDRQCGSSQQAAHFAAQGIMSGQYDVVIAGGVESMSRIPLGTAAAVGGSPWSPELAARYPDGLVNQGISAELVADRWGLGRDRLDAYAAASHQRAAAAEAAGRFDGQRVPIGGVVADETVRAGTTAEGLAALPPAFRSDAAETRFPGLDWNITAGNSSPLTDGASAALIMAEETALAWGLTPRARFHAFAVVGSDPLLMLTGPIPATERILERSGLTIDDLDAYEVNEAFASVPLAWQESVGADPEKLNPWGGAIALGHALGSSGTRLLGTLVAVLESTGGRYGLQTMCEGGGMANATIIERL